MAKQVEVSVTGGRRYPGKGSTIKIATKNAVDNLISNHGLGVVYLGVGQSIAITVTRQPDSAL